MKQIYELILNNFAKHIELSPPEVQFALSLIEHKTVKKRTTLLMAGTVSREIYFVNKGCLRLFQTGSDGNEHIIAFMPEDWWAVDVASFYGQSPAAYQLDALEDSELFTLSYENQQLLFEQVPKFERFFRILSQNGFILYQQRILQSLSIPAEQRYKQFRERYPRLEPRVAQKHVASYLGVTPVFLSMLRKRR